MIWNVISSLKRSACVDTVLRACSQCVLLAFCTFFVSYHNDFWNKYFYQEIVWRISGIDFKTFSSCMLYTASYLASVQICDCVFSLPFQELAWRGGLARCAVHWGLESRGGFVLTLVRDSVVHSLRLYSRDLKSLKWMSRMIFEYFEYENVSKFTDFML